MEKIKMIYDFLMSPTGGMIAAILVAVISELMALNPKWKSNGIIDFILKLLKEWKEKSNANNSSNSSNS